MGFDLNAFAGIHEHALKWRSERATLIARNIANADTPGYKARDIDFGKMLSRLEDPSSVDSMKLGATHQEHLGLTENGISENDLMYRTPIHPSFDGNTVDTQLEYAAFSDNTMRYMASFTFLNQKIRNLMSVIQGG